MASNTPNLNLYKKDPTIDGNDTFNIKTMLNDNWDKIDTEVAKKANQTDFNSHLADSTSHVTAAERTAWNSKAEKTYVDEQIQTVTATGIPKLVSYEYDLYATIDNQTVFTIPYNYFNSATDTLIVEISGIDVPKSYCTVTNPVTNGDGSITKGYITLNGGRPKDSFLKMRILKNVPIGPDGAISGRVMAVNSIPQDRIENISKIVQYDSDGDIPVFKGKSRANMLPNSTFNFGSLRWSKTSGNNNFNFSPLGTLYPSIPSAGEKGWAQYVNSTGSGEYAALASDRIYIAPGVRLIISGEMYTVGLSNGGAYIIITAYDKNDNRLGDVCWTPAQNGKGWTKYSSPLGVTPANTCYIIFYVGIEPNSTNTNTLWRRLKLESPQAGELNMLPSPYSQEADILLASNATTQDITYYVDSVNGNDNNDGLSAGYPFKTIGKALSVLPRTINHNVYIQLAGGTYNEYVNIVGFNGVGQLSINGATNLVNSVNYKVTGLHVASCLCHVVISGINLVANSLELNIGYCKYVYIVYCTIEGNSSANGIIVFASNVLISTTSISNRAVGIYAAELSRLRLWTVTGTGNTIGLKSDAGIIQKTTDTTITGTTATQAIYGGQIW